MNKKIVEQMWNTIDKLFFENTSPKKFFEMEDYYDYCTIKQSLISEMLELYKHMNFDPKWMFNEKYDPDKYINKSKLITEKIMKTSKFKNNIKNTILETYKTDNLDSNVEELITEKVKLLAMSLLIDNTFLFESGKMLNESSEKFDEVAFTITQSTYNLFKNELVEMINEAIQKKKAQQKENKKKINSQLSKAKLMGMGKRKGNVQQVMDKTGCDEPCARECLQQACNFYSNKLRDGKLTEKQVLNMNDTIVKKAVSICKKNKK